MKLSLKRNKQALIGVICGVLCAVCVGVYLSQVDEQAHAQEAEMLARYGGDQVEVCVAKRDIAAGQTIGDGDLETKMWIATLLPAGAVRAKEEAVGQQAGSSILAGEVISTARFGFDASSIEVPEGMVAMSVPARAVQAVGGALSPGMTVDVYAVGASSTTRIAQGAQVLEACAGEGSVSGGSWVTLALVPGKVAEMVSAAENMELYFVLPSDAAAAESEKHPSSNEQKVSSGVTSSSSSAQNRTSSSSASTAQNNAGQAGGAPSQSSQATQGEDRQ